MANNIGYDIGNNKWFLGQVPPCHNQHKEGILWEDAHGDRVKVRIPGMHPMASNEDATEVIDDDLPWAIVAKPTTNGYRNYQSSAIWGGEWVIGFFMDEDCQIPVITQVLGVNIKGGIKESINGTTLGQLVNRYTCGNRANNSQIAIPDTPHKGKPSPLSHTDVVAAKTQSSPPPGPNQENGNLNSGWGTGSTAAGEITAELLHAGDDLSQYPDPMHWVGPISTQEENDPFPF